MWQLELEEDGNLKSIWKFVLPVRMARLLFAAALCAPVSSLSSVSNIVPRRSMAGAIIDAHDGNVVEDPSTPGLYYYFAAGYGNCTEPPGLNGCATWCDNCGCGFFYNHSVNVFSTTDFTTWEAHGNVLPLGFPRPNSVVFSPKVLYNELVRSQNPAPACTLNSLTQPRRAAIFVPLALARSGCCGTI